MIENPMVTSAARVQQQQENRDTRAARAYSLLVGEFLDALAVGPEVEVSFANSRTSIADVVLGLLCEEPDLHTTKLLLSIAHAASNGAAGTLSPSSVIASLAARYAEGEIARINDEGGFDD